MGNRFRLIINNVDAVKVEKEMPKLPVARVLWRPQPSLEIASEAWILAGGAHHTVFSYEVTAEMLIDWAEIMDIECLIIDNNLSLHKFKNELRWNNLYWKMR